MSDHEITDPVELEDFLATADPMPVAVLSRNLYSLVGARIAGHCHDPWNHFFWLTSAGCAVSQDWLLKKRPLSDYTQGEHMLKFIASTTWEGHRATMRAEINSLLRLPWWCRLYDVLQIIGHRIGMPWLQIPGLSICSDLGRIIKIGDDSYNLTRATPADINLWTKARQPAYRVLCRFVPEGF